MEKKIFFFEDHFSEAQSAYLENESIVSEPRSCIKKWAPWSNSYYRNAGDSLTLIYFVDD